MATKNPMHDALLKLCRKEFHKSFGFEWSEERASSLRVLEQKDASEQKAASVYQPLRRAVLDARKWAAMHGQDPLLGEIGLALLRFTNETARLKLIERKRPKNPGSGKVPRLDLLNRLDRYVYFDNVGRLLTPRELAVVSILLGNRPAGDGTAADLLNSEAGAFRKLAKTSKIRAAWLISD